MPLITNKPYFIQETDVVLRVNPIESTKKNAENHLIMGDYVSYQDQTDGEWVFVRSRGNNGWLKEVWLTPDRMLEVNFVDIGQGEGIPPHPTNIKKEYKNKGI